MIYVNVEIVKSEGRGAVGGNDWHDTDDVVLAVAVQLDRVQRTYADLGHGAIIGYQITVATEASPRRTTDDRPLPDGHGK